MTESRGAGPPHRSGFVCLVGRPNVGKSQLFNSLAKKQQAIVADRAGTTRDVNRATVRYHDREIELLDFGCLDIDLDGCTRALCHMSLSHSCLSWISGVALSPKGVS